MKCKFYVVFYNEEKIGRTREFDSKEEAFDNAEFLERYYGFNCRLKVREED